MARSPFPANAINATLTFRVPDAGGTVDWIDESGNVASSLVDWTAKVSAKANLKRPVPENGGDLSQVRLVVTLIEPMRLPTTIMTGAQGEMVFYADPGKLLIVERTGQFILEPIVPRAYGVDDIVGQRLSGIFLSRVAWGNSL